MKLTENSNWPRSKGVSMITAKGRDASRKLIVDRPLASFLAFVMSNENVVNSTLSKFLSCEMPEKGLRHLIQSQGISSQRTIRQCTSILSGVIRNRSAKIDLKTSNPIVVVVVVVVVVDLFYIN